MQDGDREVITSLFFFTFTNLGTDNITKENRKLKGGDFNGFPKS